MSDATEARRGPDGFLVAPNSDAARIISDEIHHLDDEIGVARGSLNAAERRVQNLKGDIATNEFKREELVRTLIALGKPVLPKVVE